MDAGKQFARIKRFAEIIVSAELETENTVDVFSSGRQHDDRRHILFSAQTLEDGQTVFTRHHQVQNQHVEVFAHPKALHSFAVFADEDVEAIFAEIAAQQVSQTGVVIDNENFGSAFNHFGLLGPASLINLSRSGG